jgi:hypothetical protein
MYTPPTVTTPQRRALLHCLMKFAKYSDTSGVAPASCRHRRMPPGRRRYDEGLSPYFANISKCSSRVAKDRPNYCATAAIQISFSGMGRPFNRKDALISP